ncbi:hypothetical protein [Streptomyces albidoflavus]|uniref:hypothetical protein n=1 Tax=Streptomyces albidoflavus TaxID=1886 RepID=UPI00101E7FB3|nr:hypothetical protein [Streptomyces albidoflavus]RZD82244.1 hypothetical protein C0Q63_22670 [Streptomyces albidoflavus]
MESFFTESRTWAGGPYLHFIAALDHPAYVTFAQAHHDLLAGYGDGVGIVPAPWLHWTVQGIHRQLDENEVERTVRAVRERAKEAKPVSVTMGPTWPGPSTVTTAMYPEEPLSAISELVREAASAVIGVEAGKSDKSYWPHSAIAYFRAPDVHDAVFNRGLRKIRPPRVDITISRLLAVYMHQDRDLGFYTWIPIAEVPLGVHAADARASEVVVGGNRSLETYDSAPPWGDPAVDYEVEVGRLAVQPPLAEDQVRQEAAINNLLEDSTYFGDGEPAMSVWPDTVTVACERPSGAGVCGSTRLRVRGSWNRPAVVICEHGHFWTDSVEVMREVIVAAAPGR